MGSLTVHSYKRWANKQAYNFSNPNTELNVAHNFQLALLPNNTEFSNLYDRYMITMVVVKIRLINNMDSQTMPNLATGGNPDNIYPRVWYCPDFDDNNTETVLELKERSGVKMRVLKPDRDLTIKIKPAVNIQTYRTAVSTGYAPAWKQWIDIAQPDVPHYGVKWAMEIGGFVPIASYPYSVVVETLYYFKCKDVR